MKRALLLIPVALVAAVALWHPPARPPIAVASAIPSVGSARASHAKHPRPVSTDAVVYVVGAVARPGLYRIGAGARIDDAVRRAGGLRADADPAGVNLAAHAGDGDEIDVPVRGERATAAAPRAKRTRGKRTVKTTQPVNVNDADARQLALIPGIGPAIAARIVAVRDRDGAFTSLDQLLDVAGMTQARLDRAQDFLRVN